MQHFKNTKSRILLFIRHPEARKNVEDIHGGKGASLTEKGLGQCEKLAEYLKEFNPSVEHSLLVGHNVPQVMETVDYLQNRLKFRTQYDERLRGCNLGVIAGLSRKEAAKRYPKVAHRLQLWREGKLNLKQLNLPGAESLEAIKNRIDSLLNTWLAMNDVDFLIAICTTSVVIMLVNLILRRDNFTFEDYRVYDFDVASITEARVLGEDVQVTRINSLKHLVDKDRT